MFHPRGMICRAEVLPLASEAPAFAVAERLAGAALVRLSSALWKDREWPDVLGVALRFTDLPLTERPGPTDQDLLLATIRRPWTMLLAPFSTHFHDFLANDYYAVSPFDVRELGRVEWRIRPECSSPPGARRGERLRSAVIAERASLVLEYAPYRPPWRFNDEAPFTPLARITLQEFADLDQEALRFDPFRAGRGIVPVGMIHALRRATYATSQFARPARQ